MYLRYEKETPGKHFSHLIMLTRSERNLTPDLDTKMSPQRWVSTISSLSQLSASISVFWYKNKQFSIVGKQTQKWKV